MNAKEIAERVSAIEAVSGDDEVAHSREDALWLSVLTAIANGECDDPAACAREAIKTDDIEFARWRA